MDSFYYPYYQSFYIDEANVVCRQLGYDKARKSEARLYDSYNNFHPDYQYNIECLGNEDNVGQCALTCTSTINITMYWRYCDGFIASVTCSKTGTFEGHNGIYYHYFTSSLLDRFIF